MRLFPPSFLILALYVAAYGQNYSVYTFAGGDLPNGVIATSARLGYTHAVAVDAVGNAYFASMNVVFRVDGTTGQLARIAGNGTTGYTGDNGPATSAGMNPDSMAVDALGNVYIADTSNYVIRKVSNGVITTFAGSGVWGYSGDNGPATSARMMTPSGVAVDPAGNVYIADSLNGVIRKVSDGIITTFAGNGTAGYSGDNGPATSAELNYPAGVAADASGNVYIADYYNCVIREVSKGVITTIAGNGYHASIGVGAYSGDGGQATSAELNYAWGVAVDASNNVYIADTWNYRVRKVSNGVITTIAGNGLHGSYGDNGAATSAGLDLPYGVAVDTSGNVYIADTYGYVVRRVSNDVITTSAGGGRANPLANGPATRAELSYPYGVAVDRAGNVYIADSGNNIIRKVSNGVITTFAGNGLWGYSGENGPATSASLAGPSGVAVDAAGNVYIADTFNNVVRKVSNGLITTFAGNRLGGYLGDNGPATRAELSYPYGVAVDASGSVYIADSLNDVIRKVLNGVITTFAGNGTYGYSGDNGPATDAMLRQPYGVAADASGNVYIADSGNQLIRKVTNGVITTILQGGLIHPCGVAVDASGNVYATDLYMIWKVSNGAATMIAGNETPGYSGDDGPATNAEFNQPFGVAVDAAGDVYIADTFNYVTRVLVSPIAAQAVSLSAETCSGSLPVNIPAGVAWTASSNDSWITITGGASGTGSGAVSFTVQPNTGAARTGSITIAGQTFTIEQQSASATGLSFAGSLAQIASAGGWDTVLTLVNLGTTAGEARLNLFAADGTTPWLPYTFPQAPSQGTVLGSTFDETLNAGAMLVMDTAGPAGQAVIAGSAQLQARGNVNGFGIFEIRSTGQQSVVPLETRNASSYLLAFDETNGLNTGLALANVSPVAGNVNVVVRDDTGAVIPTKVSSIPLDGSGHTSFMLNDPTEGFPEIEGKRGTVEFDTPTGGQISVLGLRANGKAITTLPVLAQVGTTGGAFAHVASGGGWETSFTLVNTGSSAAPFTLHFYDATTGLALPLTFGLPQNGPATQSASSITQTLAPGATLVIQTQGGSATFACSAELTTTGPISGFAIFRVQESGQEAVVPLETRAPNAFVLAYDNTKSVATGVALANVSAQAATVPVIVRDDTGATIANGQIALAANGHTSFLLTDTALGFPSTAGKRGTIEFDKPAGGRISVLGIRAVTNVITTIPVMAVQ